MASSTFTHAYLVDFESVLKIPDNEGMQNMLKALESSGLRGFLGFAGVFELPTEGLSDFSNVPRNLVSDARKIFSKSGVPVVPHGKKKLLKYENGLLNDILEKSITVKVGSFDAVTTERFQMMTAIHFGLKVNWSKILFGVLEEMVDRTVKRAKGYYVHNHEQTADTRGQSDEGGRTPVDIVKRASKSKKMSESTSDAPVEIVFEVVGSKKRPATEGNIAIGLVMVAENRLVDCISEDIYQQTSLLYRESFLPTDIETVQEMFVFGTVHVTFAINRFGNSKFNATSFAINRYDDVSYSRNIRYHFVTIRFSDNGHITDMMTSATV
ncbi:GDSL esterase/lipase-like [Dorcoceras hygrometricum]|uniref:GDSL esterase/lipase-like n=1 Tax=Dorcoceras hygrometricum TaxID=472368 RepID=A0A2Z7CSQ5_9LAMI|nr:GDSL esterase/lipase-like [Dorcoceras hygrometricum]